MSMTSKARFYHMTQIILEMWDQSSSISMEEVIITSVLWGFERESHSFKGGLSSTIIHKIFVEMVQYGKNSFSVFQRTRRKAIII